MSDDDEESLVVSLGVNLFTRQGDIWENNKKWMKGEDKIELFWG